MKTVFIYSLSTLEDPFNIRYIGKADDINSRLDRHLQPYYLAEGSYKARWLKSELKKGHTPIINFVDEVLESEWEFWETFWISQFKSWGFKLTNGTIGGEGFGITQEVISRRNKSNFDRNTIRLKDEIEKYKVRFENDLWISERNCPGCDKSLIYKKKERGEAIKAAKRGFKNNRTCLNCRDCVKNLGKYYKKRQVA
jgi:hypothetical protein